MSDRLARARPVEVLESFGPPHERTNPYSVQLFAAFPDRVHAHHFSWRSALKGDYEVFHLHWPEVKVRGTTPLRSFVRGTLFLLLLVRIRLGRRALVRTLHDLTPHEAPNRLQRWVIGLSERWTTLWITLNRSTRPPTTAPERFAPIGNFVGWFPPTSEVTPVRGRLLHFGLVRRYKGVETLIDEFRTIDDRGLELRVVGAIHEPMLAQQIARASETDARITAVDAYVSDEQLRDEILASELVVLPFAQITNSSSLLVALSLGRPVLAPAAPSILEVAQEVGDGWVHIYEGELQADHITAAIRAVRAAVGAGAPDLSARDWTIIGELHADAFAEARDLAARRPRRGARNQRSSP
jgi:beta-1,4-mannosyltransferase